MRKIHWGTALCVAALGAGPAFGLDNELRLDRTESTCHRVNDTVTVELKMKNLTDEVSGFQAFIKFNPDLLQHTSTTFTESPFGLVVLAGAPQTPGPQSGNIDLAAGIDFQAETPQSPTNEDSLLVTLTFTIRADACLGSVIEFRDHTPPTRITKPDLTRLFPLNTVASAAITADDTAPSITQGTIAPCYSSVEAAEAAAKAATTVTEACDPNRILNASTTGTCPATITVTATDCAGNVSNSVTYTTKILTTNPTITTCPQSRNLGCNPSAESLPTCATVQAETVAIDGCGQPATVACQMVPDSNSGCVHTRTFTITATDTCGHSSSSCDVTYTWTVDTTPPTAAMGTIGAFYTDVAVANQAALDATTNLADNCGSTPTKSVQTSATLGCSTSIVIRVQDSCEKFTDYTYTTRVENTPPEIIAPLPDVTVQCIEDADPGLPYATVGGGIAIYYNDNGLGENPANQAYLKTQFSATDVTTGAPLAFSTVPLTGAGPLTWVGIYNDQGQFGLDLVLPRPPTSAPVLTAYDNGNNDISGRIPVGPVAWAIDDYKPHLPNLTAGAVLNSLVRGASPATGSDIVLTRNDVTLAGTVYTAVIKGYLVSDGFHHWYNPATTHSPLSNFGLNGKLYFSGTLTYDSSTDTNPLMDFYAGTITITANFPSSATGFATATDNCTMFPVIAYSDSPPAPHAGPACPALNITRTWTATDECGNIGSKVQHIIVSDTTPPTVIPPAGVTVECNAIPVAPPTVPASDNCDAGLTVATYQGETITPGSCPNSYTITRTWTVTDACANTGTGTQIITVQDTTLPVLTVPPDVTVHCLESTDPPATGNATATDNCGSVTVTYDDDRTELTGCNATGNIVRTWTATDACSNSSSATQRITVVDETPPVIAPKGTILQNADAGHCTAKVTYTNPTATDSCYFQGFEDEAFQAGNYANNPSVDWNDYNSHVYRATSLDTINPATDAALAVIDSVGTPVGTTGAFCRLRGYSSVFGTGFTTSVDVYLNLDDPAVRTANTYGWDLSSAASNKSGGHLRDFIFHTASDASGHILVAGSNNSTGARRNDLASLNHYTVTTSGWYTFETVFRANNDGMLAVDLNLRQGSVVLWTETRATSDSIDSVVGGNRYMWFTFLAVEKLAIDNTRLIRNVSVTCTPASGSIFPGGTTPVICTATDACGKQATSSFDVTVSSYNELKLSLELQETVVASALTRNITLELARSSSLPTIVQTSVSPNSGLTFTNGKAQDVIVLVNVPTTQCDVPYTCITARDRLHTLRRTLGIADFKIVGTQYVADFINATGGNKKLIGGNLNDDEYIDILDFAGFALEWSKHYPGAPAPDSGNTTFSTPSPHADVTGDGQVGTGDFSFIYTNFLQVRDLDCYGAARPASGPRTSVPVSELKSTNKAGLAIADLNADGVVDSKDVALWIQGGRPGKPLPTPPKRTR